MAGNKNLQAANKAKYDEYYTQLADIERELRHYKEHFRDKTVLCNCDDPRVSNFFHYFSYNFHHLGLRRLITTCYKNRERDLFSRNDSERAIWLEYTGTEREGHVPTAEEIGIHYLKGDGDFRSPECVSLLMQADIVVTNPPFSLFREYVEQLMGYNKKFLILGNKNSITYKGCFNYIKDNRLWTGVTPMGTDMLFDIKKEDEPIFLKNKKQGSGYRIVEGRVKARSQSTWFTNIEIPKRHEELILVSHYTPEEYPTYDNCNAIHVNKVSEIPCDYDGVMGVPITFLDKYNPRQFELIKFRKGDDDKDLSVNGKCPFFRILIRRRQ